MKSISKFALAASIGLAMALTFSCSGDDGEGDGGGSSSSGGTQGGVSSSSGGGGSSSSVGSGGGYLSCSELENATNSCINEYGTDDELINQCIIDKACVNIDYEECQTHYLSECYGGDKQGGKGNDISNYRTVEIGDQIWMAENLDYYVEGSKCYGNLQSNCDLYGRLYDWSTAMALDPSCNLDCSCSGQIQSPHRGICPSGWHIPSDDEWYVLVNFAGGQATAGKKLKAISGWENINGSSGNGTDTHGFSALPGGGCNPNGYTFYSVGFAGRWYSATENGGQLCTGYGGSGRIADGLDMSYSIDKAEITGQNKSAFFSVRCVKD